MATKKRGKGKSKAKRRKAPVAKPARKKTARAGKKPVKRARPAKRASAAPRETARPAAAPAQVRPAAPRGTPAAPAPTPPPAQPAPPGERIGVVTHYYSHLSVAIVRLESGTLRVGDLIHFRGHTTDFGQRVESLEVEHAPVTEVGSNDEFGIKVREHAREHDVVYKVRA